MLVGIDVNMPPDLLDCLMRMGHGDEIVVVGANFPAVSTGAKTLTGKVIQMSVMDAVQVVGLITGVMPLDPYSEACAYRMQADNDPETIGPVQADVCALISAAMPDGAEIGSVERQDFYWRAAQAYAVVATSEMRPFGCFILRKGVIFP